MKSCFTVSRTGEASVLRGAVFKIKKEIAVQTIRSTVLAVEREEKMTETNTSGHPRVNTENADSTRR